MRAADGTPLRVSLARSLRRQKLRALLLVAPLLLFVLVTFVAPIGDMLLRSVQNGIVPDTLPRTVAALAADPADPPGEAAFQALLTDLSLAEARKLHTQLGSRLNYESPGFSSLIRGTGRSLEDMAEAAVAPVAAQFPPLAEGAAWAAWMDASLATPEARRAAGLAPDARGLREALPRAADAWDAWSAFARGQGDDPAAEDVPPFVVAALLADLQGTGADALSIRGLWSMGQPVLTDPPFGPFDPFAGGTLDLRAAFVAEDEAWGDPATWATIRAYSGRYTAGYYVNAVDLQLTPDGIERRAPDDRIYLLLFARTFVMSLLITGVCILLGYPVAWLLANLPARTANLLMILVLLPFWTSLLVRTSAWKVLLQQQGVVNDILVWLGLVGDQDRLLLINNQLGTVIAMTHILLPFMILPLYSVMKGILPSYLRAAKSLGANDWTAFWRVYFPQTIPGIGAGSILCFILAIGYYITPELVGGTRGVFISNRIAYHISDSLNWGLAAALSTILLAAVLLLYWLYDRFVGIDNVKLGG